MNKLEILQDILGGVEENHLLRGETRVEAGGVSEFYYQANDLEGLMKASAAALIADVPYVVIGGGSNVLFSDLGYKGFVIKNSSSNISFLPDASQVIVDSGVSLSKLALESSARDLAGLEPFVCVPGTIGAAVLNNISSFSIQISNLIKSATILFPKENNEFQVLKKNKDWLNFSSHYSKLCDMPGRKPVILSLKLQLAHNKKEDVLKRLAYFQKLSRKIFPLGEKCLMIFKEELTEGRRAEEFIRGLDKFKIKKGTVSLSKINLNFIKNQGRATAEDFRSIIEDLKLIIREKTGVSLRENIEYFGNWSSLDMEKINEETQI